MPTSIVPASAGACQSLLVSLTEIRTRQMIVPSAGTQRGTVLYREVWNFGSARAL